MNRKQAKERGEKTYDGKPCKNCGSTKKYTSNWSCVSCELQRTLNRDPDIFKRYIKSEKGQKWLKEFRRSQTYRSIQNKWYNESGFGREQQARRRKQIRQSYNNLSILEKEKIKEIYKEAARLTIETDIIYHVDHIVRLADGGTHTPDNLQILTFEEHVIKTVEENTRGEDSSNF